MNYEGLTLHFSPSIFLDPPFFLVRRVFCNKSTYSFRSSIESFDHFILAILSIFTLPLHAYKIGQILTVIAPLLSFVLHKFITLCPLRSHFQASLLRLISQTL